MAAVVTAVIVLPQGLAPPQEMKARPGLVGPSREPELPQPRSLTEIGVRARTVHNMNSVYVFISALRSAAVYSISVF